MTDDQKRRIQAAAQPTREIVVTNLAGIEPVNLKYLWRPYLPLGKVVIVAGAPGHGKSQLTALMAGLATRGSFFPSDVVETSRVLIMSAEDDLDDTVVPRLLAVGADLRLVDTITTRTTYGTGLQATGMIHLPGDVEALHAYVKAKPDARLAILDPVASFFGRDHSTTVNQDVRDALDPLVAIAKTYMVTVVVILHLNKTESRDFANRISESHGFQALARCVIALGPDPDDPDGERGSKKILAVTKANLAKAGLHAMRAEVRGATVLDSQGRHVETSELVLTGKCEISADDLLMSAGERTQRLEAASWLEDFVGERWVKSDDVKKAAISDGFSWRTIERVRESVGYQRAKQAGVNHGAWWIAAKTTTTPIPIAGGLAALGGQDRNTAKDSSRDVADLDPNAANAANNATTNNENGGENNSTTNDQLWTDLNAYRAERDRRLGERDDD